MTSMDTFIMLVVFLSAATLSLQQQQGTLSNAGLQTSDEASTNNDSKDKNLKPEEVEEALNENAKNFKMASEGSHIISRTGLFGIDKSYSIKYKLFNRITERQGEVITYTNKVANTSWIPGQNVVFVIHGWMQSAEEETNSDIEKAFGTSMNIRDAYLESNRSENVILVNWEEAAFQLNFLAAAKESYIVGKAIAHMIISLKIRKVLNDYSQVKIVGFSMGAHVAGVAGYYIQSKLKTKIGEITGLDPLAIYFENKQRPMKIRLDNTDAEFVQVIHCNMGEARSLFDPHFGTKQALGHVDFYPNGGVDQPQCPQGIKTMANLCSHFRCSEFYASSVRGSEYKGCPCEDLASYTSDKCNTCNGPLMGDGCPRNATGKYYLKGMPLKVDLHQGS